MLCVWLELLVNSLVRISVGGYFFNDKVHQDDDDQDVVNYRLLNNLPCWVSTWTEVATKKVSYK